jgi:HEPN domain-containing protein
LSYERYRDWLEEAVDDLEAARVLLQAGRWSKVRFLSHQAVKKALKALCIRRLGVYLRTHSVARLVEEVSRVVRLPEDLVEKVRRLDRYYIPTRYPNAWPALPPYRHYSREDAEEALRVTEDVVELVKREVEGGPQG